MLKGIDERHTDEELVVGDDGSSDATGDAAPQAARMVIRTLFHRETARR